MNWLWGALAAVALLWPDRISGPLDGVPLDRVAEAIVVGAIFPALCALHPRFLATSFARLSIAFLLVWKICSATMFVQDGWCVRFDPARPYAKDAAGAPHSWDLRADWRTADPACSAVMTRSYHDLDEFPVWFFNLPPPSDSWPTPEDRPPGATVGLSIRGFLHARDRGYFQLDTDPSMRVFAQIDGRPVDAGTAIAPGLHIVAIDGTLTGGGWRLVPRWNGQELWDQTTTTVAYPSRFDLLVRPWIAWIPVIAASALLLAWLSSAVASIGDAAVLAWAAGASLVVGWLIAIGRIDIARWIIAGLSAGVLIHVPPRLRTLRGAFILVGVPWMTFVVASSVPDIGRWILRDVGSDHWMFQRFSYRIVMQGYWLEGGSETFWFQGFYRWIVGVLHVLFGDSSVGEAYWDGACLFAGGLLAFQIARTFAGFRWGIAAAAMTLAMFVLGTARVFLGQGLADISSAGLLSLAALCAIHNRRRRTALAIAAGVFATFSFYTRLNNFIAAVGVTAFALPLRLAARAIVRPHSWWPGISWRAATIIPAIIALGVLFFAWRTWYYTGVFSLFHGTSGYLQANWQPGMTPSAVLRQVVYSVMVVLTVNDPPRFDIFAVPVLIGTTVAVLSLCGIPRLRTLPLAAVLFLVAGVAASFLAYSKAYPGRFSVHIMPVASALTICAAASLRRQHRTPDA
jgi:hypothetical protein